MCSGSFFYQLTLPGPPSCWADPLYFTPCAQGPQLNVSVPKRRPQGLEPCPLLESLRTTSFVPDPEDPGHTCQAHVHGASLLTPSPYFCLVCYQSSTEASVRSQTSSLPQRLARSRPRGTRSSLSPPRRGAGTGVLRLSRPFSIHPLPGGLTCTELGLLRGPWFAKPQVNPRAVSPQG